MALACGETLAYGETVRLVMMQTNVATTTGTNLSCAITIVVSPGSRCYQLLALAWRGDLYGTSSKNDVWDLFFCVLPYAQLWDLKFPHSIGTPPRGTNNTNHGTILEENASNLGVCVAYFLAPSSSHSARPPLLDSLSPKVSGKLPN